MIIITRSHCLRLLGRSRFAQQDREPFHVSPTKTWWSRLTKIRVTPASNSLFQWISSLGSKRFCGIFCPKKLICVFWMCVKWKNAQTPETLVAQASGCLLHGAFCNRNPLKKRKTRKKKYGAFVSLHVSPSATRRKYRLDPFYSTSYNTHLMLQTDQAIYTKRAFSLVEIKAHKSMLLLLKRKKDMTVFLEMNRNDLNTFKRILKQQWKKSPT